MDAGQANEVRRPARSRRDPAPPRGRGRRIAGGLALVAGVAAVAALVLRAALAPPAWYAPPTADDAEAVRLAERVEYRLAEELQRVRPTAEPWSVRLTDAQVNAWLALRLPAWVRQETGRTWPAHVGPPQVRTRPSGLVMAASAGGPFVRTGVSLTVAVRPRDAGGAEAAAGAGVAGRAEGVETARPPEAGGVVGAAGAARRAASDEPGERDEPAAGDPRAAAGGGPAGTLAAIGLEAGRLELGRWGGDPSGLAERLLRSAGVAGPAAARTAGAMRDPGAWLDELLGGGEGAPGEAGGSGEGAAAGPGRGPILPLADGRRVRLAGVELEAGSLVATFVPVAGGGSGD